MVRPLVINNTLHDHYFTVCCNVNILNESCQKLLDLVNDKQVPKKFSWINEWTNKLQRLGQGLQKMSHWDIMVQKYMVILKMCWRPVKLPNLFL